MNSWVKLLEAFREGWFPDYNYGLTLRFIIGACQAPVERKIEKSEEDRIDENSIIF